MKKKLFIKKFETKKHLKRKLKLNKKEDTQEAGWAKQVGRGGLL